MKNNVIIHAVKCVHRSSIFDYHYNARQDAIMQGEFVRGYDQWMTPPNIIELARETMGSIDFDPASNYIAQQYVKAEEYCIAPEDNGKDMLIEEIYGQGYVNGLSRYWHGNVWCNPPYSAGTIDAFEHHAMWEWSRDSVIYKDTISQMMFLTNSATDARWYHDLLANCSVLLLWRGRIKFWKMFDGKAHEKWEGEKSKAEGKGKIGNSPRYLNSLFYFGRTSEQIDNFCNLWQDKGTIVCVR